MFDGMSSYFLAEVVLCLIQIKDTVAVLVRYE